MGRPYNAGGTQAELESLWLEDHYVGLLEAGSPGLLRRFRIRQLESELAEYGRGLYVHGLDRLREEVDAGVSEWMPVERVRAVLRSGWSPDGTGFTSLTVVWFQDISEDPFRKLAEIVAPLSWVSLAAHQQFDD